MAMMNLLKHIFLLGLMLASQSNGDKLQSKIYKKLKHYYPCVLLTNATHSIGCTSNMNGNVGVLHLIKEKSDLDWLLKTGPHKPYIPLISSEMFTDTTMKSLMASKKINGALIINGGQLGQTPIKGFSPDPSCPLDDFGMYSNEKEYANCKKMEWNREGNSLSMIYYDLPIFALSSEEEVNETIKCIEKHNLPTNAKSAPSYPLCAVELKDFMFAAKDTPTCMRKSSMPLTQNAFCDPLGDWNVWGTLYPMTSPPSKRDVIIISTKMDSTSFFHDLAPGANNDVSGIVTLLGVAYALGSLKREINAGNAIGHKMKPIVFSLFNGEVWDYIGSSRMVWDMENGNFPINDAARSNIINKVTKMDLSDVGYFIDINQVGQVNGGSIWLHTDPVTTKNDPELKREVEKMTSYMAKAGADVNLSFKNASSDLPLPPASLQRFLRSKKSKKIAGIVVTDHEKQFNNKYYNSRFDNAENIGLKFELVNKDGQNYLSTKKEKTEEFAKLAGAIATAVYKLATDGQEPSKPLNVSAKLIANLLSCFLISASCPGFREILPVNSRDTLPQKPYSRYISVAQLTNPITDVIYSLLGYYTGNWTSYNQTNCQFHRSKLPDAISTIGIKGPFNQSAICVKFSVYRTAAVSPAFEIKDYTSTEFSTWAESMWTADFGVRMFLVDGPTTEYLTFCCGALVLIISFIVVCITFKKSELLFTPRNVLEITEPTNETGVN